VIYPAWDPQHPATLSSAILTGILREEMGFTGVIVSDDLGMAAVAETMPWEELPLLALQAGVDLLLICHDRQRQENAYRRVLNVVQRGKFPEALLDRAVARGAALKSRLNHLRQGVNAQEMLACIGSAAHQALVETICAPIAEAAVERHIHGK
jgi:beta-N-acetylhexosaminidase